MNDFCPLTQEKKNEFLICLFFWNNNAFWPRFLIHPGCEGISQLFGELCKYGFDSSGKGGSLGQVQVPTPTLETNNKQTNKQCSFSIKFIPLLIERGVKEIGLLLHQRMSWGVLTITAFYWALNTLTYLRYL